MEMRKFESGAIRDTDENKVDYEGFLCPYVIQRYGLYMHQHRVQSDGELRSSDNWKKGIPADAYMKSMWRHFLDVWIFYTIMQDPEITPAIKDDMLLQESMEESLCALLFNVMGMLREMLRITHVKD